MEWKYFNLKFSERIFLVRKLSSCLLSHERFTERNGNPNVYLCYETKFFVDCSYSCHEQSFFRILFFINESPLWCLQNGPRPLETRKTWDGLGLGRPERFPGKGGFWEGALQVKKGEGVYQADGARGRPCQQMRGTAEGQQEGGQNLRLKRWTEISNAMKPSADHTSPSGADTPSGDHAYPIHGDVGPVVDAPVG